MCTQKYILIFINRLHFVCAQNDYIWLLQKKNHITPTLTFFFYSLLLLNWKVVYMLFICGLLLWQHIVREGTCIFSSVVRLLLLT